MSLQMSDKEFTEKTVVIVRFGPAFETSGFRAGEYFQVTIDPSKVSTTGEYIRFGDNPGDELMGWQRVAGLTVVEQLGVWESEDEPPTMTRGKFGVTMLVVE
jgi:hypothetical protein